MSPSRIPCIIAFAFLLAGAARMGAQDASLSPALQPVGTPAMQGVVYRFFDDTSGNRTGQVKIGSITMEYRKQGFLRVAWKPLVVLAQVDFDFQADMAWSRQGLQVGQDLLALGGHEELVLREVRLRLAGTPSREIVAPTARLLAGGALEFQEATIADNGGEARPAGTLQLLLTGPNAGQLINGSSGATLASLDKISSTPAHSTLAQ